MYGSCIAYLVFIGDNMASLFSLGLSDHSGMAAWVCISLVILLPLCYLKQMNLLALTSGFGMMSVLAAVAIITYFGFTAPPFDEQSPINKNDGTTSEPPLFNIKQLPVLFGLAAFSNEEIVGLCLPIHASTPFFLRGWYMIIAAISVGMILVMNLVIGIGNSLLIVFLFFFDSFVV